MKLQKIYLRLIAFFMLSAIIFACNLPVRAQDNSQIDRDNIELSLVNTTWEGTYEVNEGTYTTKLLIKSVAANYIGAEVIHQEIAPGSSGYLKVKIAGDIIEQYLIDPDGDKDFQWVDEDSIDPTFLAKAEIRDKRQLVRMKRFRAFEYKQSSFKTQGWSTNREYRLLLKDNTLTGIVGIPARVYGSTDGTEENGNLVLTKK